MVGKRKFGNYLAQGQTLDFAYITFKETESIFLFLFFSMVFVNIKTKATQSIATANKALSPRAHASLDQRRARKFKCNQETFMHILGLLIMKRTFVNFLLREYCSF